MSKKYIDFTPPFDWKPYSSVAEANNYIKSKYRYVGMPVYIQDEKGSTWLYMYLTAYDSGLTRMGKIVIKIIKDK